MGNVPEAISLRRWTIEPAIGLRGTWTDNIGLQPRGAERSEFATEILPSIAIRGRGARARLDFEYQPTALIYARDSQNNDILNSLSALGTVEAVERILFLDARAQITQQSVSPFGTQTTSNVNSTSNRTETRILSLSPYSRGLIGDWALYDLRYQASITRTADDVGANSDSRTWSARLESARAFANLGWILEYQDSRNTFDDGDATRGRIGRATVTYRIRPELAVFARGGSEYNNYTGPNDHHVTHGFGLQWAPTERTRISAENDKRFFGRGYLYSVQHRTSQTAWSLIASKDETTTTSQLTRSSVGSLLDRFSDLATAQSTDPDQRANQARQLLSSTGFEPQSIPQAGYLSAGILLEKRIEGSVALIGVRNTGTLSAYRRDTRQLTVLTAQASGNNLLQPDVRERGFTVNWNHRLSALTSFSLGSAWQRNSGAGNDGAQTTLRRLDLTVQRQLGPRTTASAGIRHVRSDSQGEADSDYRENAILVAVSHRF